MAAPNSSKSNPIKPPTSSLRFHQLPGPGQLPGGLIHGASGAHSVSSSFRTSASATGRFTRSIDNHLAYELVFNSWDTLSAGIADKIRSGSIRQDRSAQFAAIEEERPASSERHPLLNQLIEDGKEDDERIGISWVAVAFGLANASIGVGILNHPFLYQRIGGIGLSIIIQLILILVLFLSMAIIIYCADLHKSCSYHETLSSICGKRAKSLVAADIAMATYGICIAYLVIIGDQYDRLFASLIGPDFCKYWYLDRKVMITITSLLIYPICLLRRLDFLTHTGPLGMFAMLYVVFLSVYEHLNFEKTGDDDLVTGINNSTSINLPSKLNTSSILTLHSNSSTLTPEVATSSPSLFELLSCVPVILFGYQCNEVIVPIYASLKDRRIGNFMKAAIVSYGTLVLLYCTVGIFGYLTYGSSVTANVMLMFNASDPAVLVGIFALIFKMVVTYPQMAFAGREAIEDMKVSSNGQTLDMDACVDEDCREKRRITTSTIWFVTSVVISAFAPHIGIVLELLGTLAAFNVFICPALCLLFLAFGKENHFYTSLQKLFMLMVATVLIVIGLCFLTFVIIQVYIDVAAAITHGSTSLCVL